MLPSLNASLAGSGSDNQDLFGAQANWAPSSPPAAASMVHPNPRAVQPESDPAPSVARASQPIRGPW
ncbi:hypothetical protein [Cyanobium sp. Morenito 9A2]|uniref:hypothetical protein n=1 Tax=Cyanobium sp. Morenito 9A2 TaxID=2823718 RepID=UPI0020CF31A8|nr:hypothetical protein [Cyanobium sp. Morenito 9A2]